MNVSVNNILKILDAYQKDDALLNIHNDINEIFVKAMQADDDNRKSEKNVDVNGHDGDLKQNLS